MNFSFRTIENAFYKLASEVHEDWAHDQLAEYQW
jgi:hypothetical protein